MNNNTAIMGLLRRKHRKHKRQGKNHGTKGTNN